MARVKEQDRLAKPGVNRRFNFFGTVSPDNVDTAIDVLEHWEARDPGCPITITFNTNGGSVTDGLALYDTIQRLKRKGHHVTTRGTAVVASMGIVLLQAGTERVLDTRTKVLVHQGSSSFGSQRMTKAEMDDYNRLSDMLQNDILDILSERATISRDEIADRWDRRDWWMTAQEAVELGFADRVE